MATVVNEKIPLLISESWRGQVFPKCFSPKHNAQSNHYFVKKNCNTSYCSLLLQLWTLTTGLQQQESVSKFYDSLMFRCLWKKNPLAHSFSLFYTYRLFQSWRVQDHLNWIEANRNTSKSHFKNHKKSWYSNAILLQQISTCLNSTKTTL